MPQSRLAGPPRARLASMCLVGGLCLALTACSGSSGTTVTTRVGTSTIDRATPLGLPADAEVTKQESYAAIAENPFQSVAAAPLSTFSADVNTASYSNVRRFLNEGHLPPRDAVFLAELVNYFPYRYPNPSGDAPVSLTLDLAACPWRPAHRLARVGVRAKSFDPGEAPRRNLVFLIDTSGSMATPERLPLVKQSLELLVQQLVAAPNPTNQGVSDAEPAKSGQNLATAYADLAAVVAAWPALPGAIRRAVLAIVQTATPRPTGGPAQCLDDSAPAGYEPKSGENAFPL